MARNPKDLVVSYYQFHRSLRTMSYRGTFQEFCRRFMNDKRKCVRPGTSRQGTRCPRSTGVCGAPPAAPGLAIPVPVGPAFPWMGEQAGLQGDRMPVQGHG